MNRQEVLEKIAELKDRLNNQEKITIELKERLNNLEKQYEALTPSNKKWRAKKDDDYYFIRAEGTVCFDRENEAIVDNSRYDTGNYFKTREEAEFEAERLKVIAELREFATPISEFDWNDPREDKYVLEFQTEEGNNFLMIDCWHTCQFSDLCFESEEAAKAAIESIGEDRIIKYYFRRGGVGNE